LLMLIILSYCDIPIVADIYRLLVSAASSLQGVMRLTDGGVKVWCMLNNTPASGLTIPDVTLPLKDAVLLTDSGVYHHLACLAN